MAEKAYEIAADIVIGKNTASGISKVVEAFEAVQKILKDTQISANELAATMRGMGRIGKSVAAEWREVAGAMRQAANAANSIKTNNFRPGAGSAGAGAASSAAGSAAGAAMGATVASGALVPAPRLLTGPRAAAVPNQLQLTGPGSGAYAVMGVGAGVASGGYPVGSNVNGQIQLGPVGPGPRAGIFTPQFAAGAGAVSANLQKHAVENGMAAWGGYEVLKGVAGPTIAAGDVLSQMKAETAFNPASIAAAKKTAYDMVTTVPGTGYDENLNLINQTTSVTGDANEAIQMAPKLGLYSRVLSAYGKGDALTDIENALKAGELTGLTKRDSSGKVLNDANGRPEVDTAKLLRFVAGLTSTTVASGGTYDIGGALTTMRQYGAFASSASEDFLLNVLPAYQKAMGSAKAGTASSSELRSMLSATGGSGASKKVIERQKEWGLRGADNQMSKEDKELIQHNLNDYIIQRVLPALNAHGYNTPAEINGALPLIIPQATVNRLNSEGIINSALITKEANQNRKQQAAGDAPFQQLLQDNPSNQLKAFSESLHLLETMLGDSVLKPATAALRGLSDVLRGFADWAKDDPEDAAKLVKAFAGAVMLFGGAAVAGMALKFITGGSGLIALAGGIIVFADALSKMPDWLLTIIKGGAAGWAAGRSIPGVGPLIGAGVGIWAGVADDVGTGIRSGLGLKPAGSFLRADPSAAPQQKPPPDKLTATIYVMVEGKMVAKQVTDAQVRSLLSASVDGAGFNPSMSFTPPGAGGQ